MMRCCFEGCPNEGTEAPRVILTYVDAGGTTEWDVPLIMDLRVCVACRERVSVENTVSKELITSIAAMRPGVVLKGHTLEWVPFTHPDYVAMKKISPN
jgi:hypothetical protein